MVYRVAADGVLVLHAAFIAFVVLGLVAVVIGGWRGWRWVRSPWFRLTHLAAIALVVAQAWLGVMCPLTVLENRLRIAGGEPLYAADGFIAGWLQRLIFFDAEPWVFTTAYTLFGLAVVATLLCVPMRRPGSPEATTTPQARR